MRVTELWIYPIKACGGFRVTSAHVTARGLALDRQTMLVDEAGNFITQRSTPRLARVRVAEDDAGHFRVTADAMRAPLLLPKVFEGASRTDVTVWKSHVVGVSVYAEASAWFSDFLGRAVRLVFMGSSIRAVDPDFAQPGDQVSFADGFPLLLTNQASLDDLNQRLAHAVPMTRFRPNVVVTGAPAYAEDAWTALRIGPVSFRAPKICSRCVVTTVDPETGEPGKEPLKTLASYRRHDGQVQFGLNLTPDGEGTIHVGHAMEVRASGRAQAGTR